MTLSQLLARKQQATTPAATAAPVVYDADPDAKVSNAWNLSLEEWQAMTDQQREFHRWNVTKAPNFSA